MITPEDFQESIYDTGTDGVDNVHITLRLELIVNQRVSNRHVHPYEKHAVIRRARQQMRQAAVDRIYGDLRDHMRVVQNRITDCIASGRPQDDTPWNTLLAVNEGFNELREMIAACAKLEDET